jgi:hypothetical protein
MAQACALRSFFPAGLAVGSRGEIYIADSGAQRVRVLTADSTVTTLAGSGSYDERTLSVRGGYRDGRAAMSQFDGPLGVAIGGDGSVYVADSGNHCIRRIKDGVVSTYAGSPRAQSTRPTVLVNKPLSSNPSRWRRTAREICSSLTLAVELARSPRQATSRRSMFQVCRRRFRESQPIRPQKHTTMFFAIPGGFGAYRIETGEKIGLGGVDEGGERDFGHPASIVALSHSEVAFTDQGTRSISYAYFVNRSTPFGRSPALPLLGDIAENAADAANRNVEPVVNTPTGLAIEPSGSLVFSDSGNRQIRRLPAVDRRRPVSDDISDLVVSDRYYRIAYISNSYGFTNVNWPQSAAGILERELNRRGPAAGLQKEAKVSVLRIAPDQHGRHGAVYRELPR